MTVGEARDLLQISSGFFSGFVLTFCDLYGCKGNS
jgi:hypothetical protein